jgi:hypothetical protein
MRKLYTTFVSILVYCSVMGCGNNQAYTYNYLTRECVDTYSTMNRAVFNAQVAGYDCQPVLIGEHDYYYACYKQQNGYLYTLIYYFNGNDCEGLAVVVP